MSWEDREFEPFRSVEQQLEILTRRLHWVEPNIVTAKAALWKKIALLVYPLYLYHYIDGNIHVFV